MNKTSPISIVLAVLQLIGSSVGLFVSGEVQFVFFIFGVPASIQTDMFLLTAKFLFYIVTAILILTRRPWVIPIACLAGAVGVFSGINNLVRFGFAQPAPVYLTFHVIYLTWFTSLLIKNTMIRSTTTKSRGAD